MHKQEIIYAIAAISLVLILLVGGAFFVLKWVNPSKYLDKSRDGQRLNDLAKLQTGLDLYIADGHNFSNLVPGKAYISSEKNSVDGRGWLPLNFQAISSGAPFDELPIDPTNNDVYNYRIGVNVSNKTYEIDCRFENPGFQTKAKNDGGNDPDWYEIGTDLTILK